MQLQQARLLGLLQRARPFVEECLRNYEGMFGSPISPLYQDGRLYEKLYAAQMWLQERQAVIDVEGNGMKECDFGWALRQLQAGLRVKRRDWDVEFLYLVQGSTFLVNRPPLLGFYPEGKRVEYQAHIDLRCEDGSCTPWTATQSDLLANDWELSA